MFCCNLEDEKVSPKILRLLDMHPRNQNTFYKITGIKAGRASVLLASPESALTKHWKVVLSDVYKNTLCMVTYDEAQCVSEWYVID